MRTSFIALVVLHGIACSGGDRTISEGDAAASGHGGASGSDAASDAATSGEAGAAGNGGTTTPCPTFDDGIPNGTVESADVVEASGLAWSRNNPGVLWVHNDSGDSARAFALSLEGVHLASYSIAQTWATDWEDMAIGPGPDESLDYLYFGDIGDNAEARDFVTVHRVPEPFVDVSQAPISATFESAAELRFTYPNGDSHNAETLLIDPRSGDLFVVAKSSSGSSGVFRAGAPHQPDSDTELELVTTLQFGSPPLDGSKLTTAGDVSRDGTWVAVRTYDRAYGWPLPSGAPWWAAFDNPPCPLPLRAEPQGETFAWSPDGTAYATLSEGGLQPIYLFSVVP